MVTDILLLFLSVTIPTPYTMQTRHVCCGALRPCSH
jgi:hypothetical protein